MIHCGNSHLILRQSSAEFPWAESVSAKAAAGLAPLRPHILMILIAAIVPPAYLHRATVPDITAFTAFLGRGKEKK